MPWDLLEFWLENPEAQGPEQILEWWLLEEHIRRSVASIRAGLAELVRLGFVVECQHGDGRSYYLLNKERIPEIRARFKGRRRGHAKTKGTHARGKHRKQ